MHAKTTTAPFLLPAGTRWDAALDGSTVAPPPLPGPEACDLRGTAPAGVLADLAEQLEGPRGAVALACLLAHVLSGMLYGTWTCSRIRRTICSTVLPSASASYERMIRWRRMSGATALTSSGLT